MVEKLRQEGIKTYVVPTLRPFNIFKYAEVSRILKEEQIDILHIHGTRAGTNTLIPGLVGKVKIIYTVHGWSFHTGNSGIATQLRMLSERFLTKYAHLTICGSEADIKQGKKNCPEGKYQLIRNSIDTRFFNSHPSKTNIRQELGFTEQDLVISFIARLTYQKDPFSFIKAIPKVCKEVPSAKFLMVGEGELKQACIKLASQLNISEKITFLPFRNDVKELLQLTDIFVLPSLWEVIPLGLLEAMAMGKSCIATNIPGTTEALINSYNGFLVDPHAPEQIADNILRLANNITLRRKLGINARRTILSHFDVQSLVRENEQAYLKLSGIITDSALLTSDLPVAFDNPFVAS
jgi:glycosyltransferase involved in cell wall biosynthesis